MRGPPRAGVANDFGQGFVFLDCGYFAHGLRWKAAIFEVTEWTYDRSSYKKSD